MVSGVPPTISHDSGRDKWVVVDGAVGGQRSTNGVLVDGVKVARAALRQGLRISFEAGGELADGERLAEGRFRTGLQFTIAKPALEEAALRGELDEALTRERALKRQKV